LDVKLEETALARPKQLGEFQSKMHVGKPCRPDNMQLYSVYSIYRSPTPLPAKGSPTYAKNHKFKNSSYSAAKRVIEGQQKQVWEE